MHRIGYCVVLVHRAEHVLCDVSRQLASMSLGYHEEVLYLPGGGMAVRRVMEIWRCETRDGGLRTHDEDELSASESASTNASG